MKKTACFLLTLSLLAGCSSAQKAKETVEETVEEQTRPEPETKQEPETVEEPEPEPEPVQTLPADGIRQEVKDYCESYEAFVDEYVTFLKKYEQNPTDLQLLSQYGQLTQKLAEYEAEADELPDLNDAESLYLLQTMNRCNEKMYAALS